MCGDPAFPSASQESGLAAPAVDPEASGPVTSVRRRRRLVAGVVAGVCLAAGLAFLGFDEYQTHASLSDTSVKLQHTTSKLASTARSLGHAQTTLASTDGLLHRTSATLGAAQAQLKSSQSEIQQLHQQINGQQNTIAGNRQEIADLNTCLNGVIVAFNYIDVADNTDAIAELNSISTVCDKASANLP